YIAAMRGHNVVLYERNDKLGGQLLLASVPPHKEDIGTFTDWLVSRVREADVEVRTGIEATPELIVKESPDSVIIATGASPLIPNVPGVDRENVITSWDVLSGKASVGDLPIIIGGGMVGCETAEFLSAMGKRVRIVEMLDSIAIDVDFRSRIFLLERLQKLGVEIFTKTKLEEISEEGIVVSKDCGKAVLKCDTVVLAVGAKPERKLIDALRGKRKEVYSIGDCVSPRKILEAIEEGFMIGAQL
ncbi:MAG: NAD(P)/FAD-dependent oxidoreductase, partial [Candidatus Bathyarchaeia archaeon]